MFNKKFAVAGISMAVGLVMLFTTALATSGDTHGYQVYKSALRNFVSTKNLTTVNQTTVTDNGAMLFEMNSTVKMNTDGKGMSSVMTVRTQDAQENFEQYEQDGKSIVKSSNSDVYRVYKSGARIPNHVSYGKNEDELSKNPEAMKDIEKVVDALVGDIQYQIVEESKVEGKSEVSLSLSDSQIPAVVNAIASLGIKYGPQEAEKNKKTDKNIDSHLKLPQLQSDIKIKKAEFKATINKDNYIENQSAVIDIVGRDAEGKEHTVVVSTNFVFSGFNNTTPDKVDLTGKKVETIDPAKMKMRAIEEDGEVFIEKE